MHVYFEILSFQIREFVRDRMFLNTFFMKSQLKRFFLSTGRYIIDIRHNRFQCVSTVGFDESIIFVKMSCQVIVRVIFLNERKLEQLEEDKDVL